jgi:hemerythrin
MIQQHIPFADFQESIMKDAFSHYLLNHLLIDQQHLELYTALCDLMDKALTSSATDEEMDRIIDFIVEHTITHVATENRLMCENKYKYAISHNHENLVHIKSIDSLHQNHSPEYINFIINMFLSHIDYHDRLMVESFSDRTRRYSDTHPAPLL